MASIPEMAAKGRQKYDAKKGDMVKNYGESVNRAISNYKDVGFGGAMTRHYETGIRRGVQFYTATALDGAKWEKRWLAKAQEP